MFQHIKDLEALISSNEQNYYLYGSSPTSESTNPTTPSYTWQAIAKPVTKSTETISSPWGSGSNQLFSPEAEQLFSGKFEEFHGNGKIVEEETSGGNRTTNNVPVGFDSLISLTEAVLKSPPKPLQKQTWPPSREIRSVSLTGVTSLIQTSDRLPFKCISMTNLQKEEFQLSQHLVSMDTIAQWLKSLRLHKYLHLFQNMTYERMHHITEEQLAGSVTLGARNKLLTCIHKLKERYGVLCQMEQDLLCDHIDIDRALDELSQIVLTPMIPFQDFQREDVASQFLKVLVLGELPVFTLLSPVGCAYDKSLFFVCFFSFKQIDCKAYRTNG